MNVLLEIRALRQRASALEDELDAEFFPRQLQGVAAPQGPQLAAGDGQAAFFDGHGLRVAPVNRIEAQQIGEVFDLGEIIDGDHL